MESTIPSVDLDTSSKRPLLLIVEDSDRIRDFLNRILSPDFELMEAKNGAEGLEISVKHIPDLIVSDVMMPEMDGYELCRSVKTTETTNHIPVILLTALNDLDSRIEGLETGADYYLAKPFEPRELLTIAHNLIVQRGKLREHFDKEAPLQYASTQQTSTQELFLQKLTSFVHENISDPDFNVDHLQKHMGISRMQLHRKLKALAGKSATEFVRAIRLKKAAELLEHGNDNVSQIAYAVGFSSLSYFAKCFKEEFGMVPSVYSRVKTTV